MYMPINPLGYSCIKKLQRDNLWHAYNELINFYSVHQKCVSSLKVSKHFSTLTLLKVKPDLSMNILSITNN